FPLIAILERTVALEAHLVAERHPELVELVAGRQLEPAVVDRRHAGLGLVGRRLRVSDDAGPLLGGLRNSDGRSNGLGQNDKARQDPHAHAISSLIRDGTATSPSQLARTR